MCSVQNLVSQLIVWNVEYILWRNNIITDGLVFKFAYKRPYLTHDVARA